MRRSRPLARFWWKSAVVLAATLAAAACGGEPPAESDDPSAGPLLPDSDNGSSGSGSGPGSTPGQTPPPPANRVCAPSCTSDNECASTCPISSGATPCCDLAAKTCYNSATPECPKLDPDAGSTPPAY